MKKERLKDLVGRRAKLLTTIRTRGGAVLEEGSVVLISGHWRGRLHLDALEGSTVVGPGEKCRYSSCRDEQHVHGTTLVRQVRRSFVELV